MKTTQKNLTLRSISINSLDWGYSILCTSVFFLGAGKGTYNFEAGCLETFLTYRVALIQDERAFLRLNWINLIMVDWFRLQCLLLDWVTQFLFLFWTYTEGKKTWCSNAQGFLFVRRHGKKGIQSNWWGDVRVWWPGLSSADPPAAAIPRSSSHCPHGIV